MKTYVLIFGVANIVAGGPIYDCNKVKYLEERGWTVNVIPTDSGEIYIKPLQKYADNKFSFISSPPFIFTKKELCKKLDLLEKKVTISDEIVIETGTDYTAMWGELLAERLRAKHFIMFLDEKNNRINKRMASFYQFKYQRNELAAISLKSINHIFGSLFYLDQAEKHVLSACCANTVAEIKCNYNIDKYKGNYNIGSIGRLDKPFVPNMILEICRFADKHRNKKIGIFLFGGADATVINEIKKTFKQYENVSCFISGYLWPIPKDIFKHIDVFVSTAGSARVSANQNVPTIRIDVITYQPEGFFYDLKNIKLFSLKKENPTICDYLEEALINKNTPLITGNISLENEWKFVCEKFDEHMLFLKDSCTTKEYYPTYQLWDGRLKFILKKLIFKFINYDKYYKFKNFCLHKKEK